MTPVCFLGAFFTSAELQSVRLYPYTDSLHIFVVAAEIFYFLFIVYYMTVQVSPTAESAWEHDLVPAADFTYKGFRTVLDFSSTDAATPMEDWITYSVSMK